MQGKFYKNYFKEILNEKLKKFLNKKVKEMKSVLRLKKSVMKVKNLENF